MYYNPGTTAYEYRKEPVDVETLGPVRDRLTAEGWEIVGYGDLPRVDPGKARLELRAQREIPGMKQWVVAYDCGEAQIVIAASREAALKIQDDLGCPASAAYSPDEVVLKCDPWVKNGQMRCTFELFEPSTDG